MRKEILIPGSVLGGMLLVTGSCVGAGMLGLPVESGLSGFFPSLLTLVAVWIFMTFNGLLLVEINGWFYGRVNIVSMAKESFGNVGKILSWLLYLFLFYSVLVAYIAIIGGQIEIFTNEKIPAFWGSLFFVILFGIVVYYGTRPVDFFNRLLIIGLIVTYLGLLIVGLPKVQSELIRHVEFKYLLFPLPILIIAFGFQNMIPSLTAYMKGDFRRMRYTIWGGSTIALLIYFFWQLIVLGIIPFSGELGLLASFERGQDASTVLNHYTTPLMSIIMLSFSFFAVTTSFLAQSLGLSHFIADGLKVQPEKKNNWWLCIFALLPPLVFGLLYPTIFFKALNFAGGICAVALFGLLPASMAWIGRYKKKLTSSYHVRGGKTSLVLVILFSLFIIFCEIARIVGWHFFFFGI